MAPSGVATFPHRRGAHCASSALRDLFDFHGLSYTGAPPSESFVFGLAGGLHFIYSEYPGTPLPVHLLGRSGDLESHLCHHVGIELDRRETDDPEAAWEWVRDEVDAGRPTMVWADIQHLGYLDVRLQNSHHDVVVVSHDPETRTVMLADHDREQLQRCSYESFAQARNSHGFPGRNRHSTYITRFPECLPDPHRAVEAAISTAVRNMREDVAPPGTPYIVGLRGVKRFVELYSEWPMRFGDALQGALKSVRVFVAHAGTGGALFRSLYAEFLKEAASLLDAEPLRRAARAYDQLSAAWSTLADEARGRDPVEAHERCRPQVAQIGRLETAGVEALEASGYAG